MIYVDWMSTPIYDFYILPCVIDIWAPDLGNQPASWPCDILREEIDPDTGKHKAKSIGVIDETSKNYVPILNVPLNLYQDQPLILKDGCDDFWKNKCTKDYLYSNLDSIKWYKNGREIQS